MLSGLCRGSDCLGGDSEAQVYGGPQGFSRGCLTSASPVGGMQMSPLDFVPIHARQGGSGAPPL